ncbi:protein phosphatase 1, regulatory subunit 13Ba isoform X11 [Alosa pseudoharengus]|uniref:protein phosphatase 1, regulatory subunit 13Ba isoform X11 n=1 Tax=Alosa pseudoharengus TaxID=34774 RepID=UPI003F8B3C9B
MLKLQLLIFPGNQAGIHWNYENSLRSGLCNFAVSFFSYLFIYKSIWIPSIQKLISCKLSTVRSEEQRLRYLKQQDGRSGQSVPEAEKLHRLKERVDSQEAKLKKVRAMRGQVDYSKVINGNLSAEIEHVSNLFQEKQAELQAAVLKVDQLTQQLDDLRRGRLNGLQPLGGPISGTAALELRKLYQELQIRNKLNQDQSSKLQQQKEMLNKRNMEVSMMDKRIGDLRERLYKKKAEARLPQHRSLNRMNGPPSPQPGSGSSGRVAAVCPYIQVPVPGRQEGGYALPPDPLKPQSLAMTATVNHARSKSAEEEGCGGGGVRKPLGPWKVSDLDIIAEPSLVPPPADEAEGPAAPSEPAGADCDPTNDANWPALTKSMPPLVPPDKMAVGMQGDKSLDSNRLVGAVTALSKQPHATYGTYPSAGHHSTICSTSSLPRSAPATLAWQRSSPPTSRSASQQIQQRISVPPSPSASQTGSPMFPGGERPDPPLAAAVRPFVTDRGSRPQSPRKGPATMNSSSIYHMYLQPAAKGYPSSSRPAVKAVYGKPVLPSSSTSPSPVPFQHQSSRDEPDAEVAPLPPPNVENIPRPLSPTKLTPVAHSPLRYQSDADLEVLRRKLANAPRPLKKRSSITEPEGPAGPNIQKLLYQRFNTLAGGMESATAGTPFYQPDSPLSYMGPAMILTEADTTNGNDAPAPESLAMPPAVEVPTTDVPLPPPSGSPPSSDANENRLAHPSADTIASAQIADVLPSSQMSRLAAPDTTEDNSNNNHHHHHSGPANAQSSPVPEARTPPAEPETPPKASSLPSPSSKRTNLKKPGSERTGHGLRVKFNPLALLLDASLEGEFDLVQRIIYEVQNPSTANDEGITPLHNAVCAGHHHIVKFLLDFGVNVNAADSDGWTPLHCAASCNSVHLCKLLVESGAAIFATTISDVETAADKCEEMEEGYIQCSQFLYGVQEKLGVMNKGAVYALWDYEAQSPDELSFHEGDALTVLRRRDDSETDWWWARLNDKEGYVPRNLLGLYPRIKPRQRSLA